MNNMKFLVISAHPDDSDFGCAGTMAKLVREGHIVEELIVSDGSKGSHGTGFWGKKLASIREKEQKASARVLGVRTVHFLRERDGEVENTKNLRKKLVAVIRKLKPDAVFSFDPATLNSFEIAGRSHRDHRQVAEAVFDAVYPAAGSNAFFPELLKKGLKPHQIKEVWFFGTAKPNRVVNIVPFLSQKLTALFCHKSQIIDRKTLEVRIKGWARKFGKKKGFKYAEGFRVIKLT